MFDRTKEYLKFGAGTPVGVAWAMEKAYFDLRRRFPGKEESSYLRLTLQSRYPEKAPLDISRLLGDCSNLDSAIVKAIGTDFGYGVAHFAQIEALWKLPPCSRCKKYRALSTIDNQCYGCRKYLGFAACTRCRLYWDDSPKFCQFCGGKLWRITDGPGVPMISV